MKNIKIKILVGIFLAVFAVTFGTQSVFAAVSGAEKEKPAPAQTAGEIDLCGGKCTGPEFAIDVSVANLAWDALKKLVSVPFDGLAALAKLGTGDGSASANQTIVGSNPNCKDDSAWCGIANVLTPEDKMPKKDWCPDGEYVPVTEIREGTNVLDNTVGIQLHYRCRGHFNQNAYFIDGLRKFDSVFLKPLGAIIWFIAKFFEIIASFLTTFTGFALLHAYSFFSNDIIKQSIFDTWYAFANLIFTFYVIAMAIGAAQIILGIDEEHSSIKKFLPKVIVSILITSFSFVFFLVMLDVGNILTKVIYDVASGGGVQIENIAEILSRRVVPGGIENLSEGIRALPSQGMILFSGAVVVSFTGVLLFSFLSLSFVLISRTMILIIAAIIGPFAGLAYCIPGAEGLTGKWAKTLAHHAVLPAILAFFVGLAFRGSDLIAVFFQKTDLDQKLFSVADFYNGGINLSNLVTVAWIGTCLYYGSTKAIATEYTEQAIGLAKNIGGKVHGFFEPALKKTALFAGVGGAATGAFGGTAQGALAFGGAYKTGGWAYNQVQDKVTELGKQALQLTGTRAKLAAKGALFGTYRPENLRNPVQRFASGLRDDWHTRVSGVEMETKQRDEASKGAAEANIARQRGNLLRRQGQTMLVGAAAGSIQERQGNDLIMRGRKLQLAADAKESKSMAEHFDTASLETKLRLIENAQGASLYKALELIEKDVEDFDVAQRDRLFARLGREYEHIRTTNDNDDRRDAIEKMGDIHRSLRKKDLNFHARDNFLDRLADDNERRAIVIGRDAHGRATFSGGGTGAFTPLAVPELFYDPQTATSQIPEGQFTDVWSPDMQSAVTGTPNSLRETVTVSDDIIRKLIKKGDFRGNRGQTLLRQGVLRGLYKDVFASIADTNTAFTNVAPAQASQINDIIQGIANQDNTVRGQLRANSAGMRTINFHTPINLNVPGVAAPVVVNNMEELINAVLTAGPLIVPRGSPPGTAPTIPTATMTAPGIRAI